jgi:hypothetical protein
MPNTIRRESHTCPKCALPLVVLHTDGDTTFEYDVAEWSRLCRHPDTGSPLACPGMRPAVKTWVGGP